MTPEQQQKIADLLKETHEKRVKANENNQRNNTMFFRGKIDGIERVVKLLAGEEELQQIKRLVRPEITLPAGENV